MVLPIAIVPWRDGAEGRVWDDSRESGTLGRGGRLMRDKCGAVVPVGSYAEGVLLRAAALIFLAPQTVMKRGKKPFGEPQPYVKH